MTQQRRIVVIEDDAVMRALLVEALEGEGYDVTAHDREAGAYMLVREQRPAAVLLDLRLGPAPAAKEAGLRVLDQLTSDPATRGTPVIIISAAGQSIETHRPALLSEFGVWVLTKPFDLETLLAVVDKAAGAMLPTAVTVTTHARPEAAAWITANGAVGGA